MTDGIIQKTFTKARKNPKCRNIWCNDRVQEIINELEQELIEGIKKYVNDLHNKEPHLLLGNNTDECEYNIFLKKLIGDNQE